MKSFAIASFAAAALSGALFATSVTADVPPIVIKVRPRVPIQVLTAASSYLLGISFFLRKRHRVLHSRRRISTRRQLERHDIYDGHIH